MFKFRQQLTRQDPFSILKPRCLKTLCEVFELGSHVKLVMDRMGIDSVVLLGGTTEGRLVHLHATIEITMFIAERKEQHHFSRSEFPILAEHF